MKQDHVAILTTMTVAELRRFWKKVDKRGPDECWPWIGHIMPETGYGQVGIRYEIFLAHRASFVIDGGTVPEGLFVLHRCDNRACVNPEHLFTGTQLDNMRDMIQKGRANHTKNLKGEAVSNSKLTEDQVREIRRLNAEEGLGARRLAKRFGVSSTNITFILQRRAWAHVT